MKISPHRTVSPFSVVNSGNHWANRVKCGAGGDSLHARDRDKSAGWSFSKLYDGR
jgi:hypothetical protein